jgi:hypothetical protein
MALLQIRLEEAIRQQKLDEEFARKMQQQVDI